MEASGLVQVINWGHSEEIMPFVSLALFNHQEKLWVGREFRERHRYKKVIRSKGRPVQAKHCTRWCEATLVPNVPQAGWDLCGSGLRQLQLSCGPGHPPWSLSGWEGRGFPLSTQPEPWEIQADAHRLLDVWSVWMAQGPKGLQTVNKADLNASGWRLSSGFLFAQFCYSKEEVGKLFT